MPADEAPVLDLPGPLLFGDVAPGWTARGWIVELRRKAARCEQDHPDMAAHYRAWALALERREERA